MRKLVFCLVITGICLAQSNEVRAGKVPPVGPPPCDVVCCPGVFTTTCSYAGQQMTCWAFLGNFSC